MLPPNTAMPGLEKKPGIVSGGTELPAIWPSEIVGLYTILSLEEASVQDFAGFVPATGGLIAAPGPLLASLCCRV